MNMFDQSFCSCSSFISFLISIVLRLFPCITRILAMIFHCEKHFDSIDITISLCITSCIEG